MILSLLAMVASVAASQSQTWTPPPPQGGGAFPYDDVAYGNANVHDPSIVNFNGTMIMFATSGNSFAPIWTSFDGLVWHPNGPILPDSPAWLAGRTGDHKSIWAPAPVKIGNTLRVYYCASLTFGKNTSFIGMAENAGFDSTRPTVGWIDKGMLVESDAGKSNFNAIDPDVMVGPDGRQWMVYGSYWSGIYQVELDPATGLIKPGAQPLHVASNTADQGNPLEAPAHCYHDGHYYLFVTYGLAAQGIRSTYRMMVGRSDKPDGPYLGFDGRSMAEGGHTDVLKSSPPMFGPGGGNLFQDPKGDWWMAYHYYDSRRHWVRDLWGRPTLQMRKVVWQDGWPLPGLPWGINLAEPPTRSLVGMWRHQADFGDTAELELKADGHAILPGQVGSWEVRSGELLLHWPKIGNPGESWVDTLALDETKQFYVGRNQTGSVIRGIKVDAKVR